ncbi:Dihydrodipicolinate synthase [Alkalidesulfovibrio alkalitolerans DSM 16529]|uniref:4-hydroxy-tetrahydrodipicolinate synthase n=1 Tax=Alkalidesulfovibrio alkalitolerans DSM 16529 TaxID=1121439 RepID=S7T067_9BACT|nr:4-hydroxy-tetrahydrodipicolinate synthase [Alkalidesulfovibrio alkalitolerans]EPR30472.1 Dihydrodipicolinate synthase [Alkalidesulfovibrio alkalitolerans DSM 16529]
MHFQGAFTALVTPFKNGSLDEEAYRAHVEWQIEQGIHGLVPCGTTGESATLSHAEHKRVIGICVDQVKGRVPVIAGAGSNNTAEAIELTRFAKDAKADGALLITPYYNKPTQRGLVAHFKAIAAEVSMPFIVYNVPGRTGTNVLPATLATMKASIPEVVGVKEATANLTQISEVMECCGPDFTLLSGDDFTVLPTLVIGGKGVISVVSNVAPKMMSQMCDAFFAGDLARARELHYALAPLCRAMFLETNPIPVKTALGMMGRLTPELRLPLVPLEEKNDACLRDILKKAGLV